MNEDLGEEEIKNIEDIFSKYKNISTVEDVIVPIGGGLSYTVKQRVEPVTDSRVPGLSSLLDYLNTNYRRIDDDSVINNNYSITNKYNNTIHKSDTQLPQTQLRHTNKQTRTHKQTRHFQLQQETIRITQKLL